MKTITRQQIRPSFDRFWSTRPAAGALPSAEHEAAAAELYHLTRLWISQDPGRRRRASGKSYPGRSTLFSRRGGFRLVWVDGGAICSLGPGDRGQRDLVVGVPAAGAA